MINANKEKLSSFFIGNNIYEVPFFQRSYVWDEENWSVFWEHTLAVLEEYENGKEQEHFIGTIITKQRASNRIGEAIHDLIDGQQRMTTVALLLKALRDRVDGTKPRLREIVEHYLWFVDSVDTRHYRISHGKYDREVFERVMDNEASVLVSVGVDDSHKIMRAYRYFYAQLTDFDDTRLETLKDILLERIPVISMMLAPNDDEQEIFDTINALGVRLTTGELLKNFIFMDEELQPYFTKLWEEPFESNPENIEFWGEPKTAGRIIRTNIEVLLYCYLIIKTGREVKLERLFNEYKVWLKGADVEKKMLFLEELRDYARLYMEFPSSQDFNQIAFEEHEKRFFHLIENLSITTAYPLVLYLYKLLPSNSERIAMLRVLESYLVRRNVCKLTTKNYNQLFIQMMNNLEGFRSVKGSIGTNDLVAVIQAFTDESNRQPNDAEFRGAFSSIGLSNQNAREILFCIALKQASEGMSDMPTLSLGTYSVEHMLPQTWEPNWTERPMNADEKAARYIKLRTLGNLTLVTKKLNSTMQNAAWDEKKEFLRPNSALRMTTDYLSLPSWNELTIEARASDLASVALTVWPLA